MRFERANIIIGKIALNNDYLGISVNGLKDAKKLKYETGVNDFEKKKYKVYLKYL